MKPQSAIPYPRTPIISPVIPGRRTRLWTEPVQPGAPAHSLLRQAEAECVRYYWPLMD